MTFQLVAWRCSCQVHTAVLNVVEPSWHTVQHVQDSMYPHRLEAVKLALINVTSALPEGILKRLLLQ